MASGRTRRKIHRKKKKKRRKMMMIRARTTTNKIVTAKDSNKLKPQGLPCVPWTSHLAVRVVSGDQPPVARREPDGGRRQQQGTAAQTKDPDEQGRRRVHGEHSCCSICGDRSHNEYFCAYNYMDGRHGLCSCRAQCSSGQHAMASSSSSSESLRCFVRVSNVPSSLSERELGWLFARFGPVRKCVLTRAGAPGGAGFGLVTFKEREHAEVAVDELHGRQVHDRKLRVDWAYPRSS